MTDELPADPFAPELITRGERAELATLARKRGRLVVEDLRVRAAEQKADVETALARKFGDEDEMVRQVLAEARDVIAVANRRLRDRASVEVDFYVRGENSEDRRRAELRRVAAADIDAEMKAAVAKVNKAVVETETALISSGLTSDAARAFLTAMPTAAELMPPSAVAAITSR